MDEETIKTTCLRCLAGCGMRVQGKDGRPVSVAGDPDSVSGQGILCVRGKATLDHVYDEKRLTVPLIREDEGGTRRLREATWDEALSLITASFSRLHDITEPSLWRSSRAVRRDISTPGFHNSPTSSVAQRDEGRPARWKGPRPRRKWQ